MGTLAWTISPETGGKDKAQLDGMQIVPDGNGGYTLQTSGGKTLDSKTLTFSYNDGTYVWNIYVTSLGDTPSGTWENSDPNIEGGEDGTWTAQAGGGADPKSASSASAK